jgi:hypothetical protein
MQHQNPDKPETIRAVINAVRRRNGIIKMALLLVPIGLLGCWLSSGHPEYGEVMVFTMFAHIVVSLLIDLSDVCPGCHHNISNLPDEGHFLMPRISRQVHVCPFCSANFDKQISGAGSSTSSKANPMDSGSDTQNHTEDDKGLTSHGCQPPIS